MGKFLCVAFLCLFSTSIYGQHHQQKYYPETNPTVLKKLEQWQDLKFGMLMHWGPYSQWGIVESWSICPEDYDWCQRKKEGSPNNYNDYVTAYEKLQTTFNPIKFNPDRWAQSARNAGMRYLVFTTKHHDGFCMFDSKYTDYKITDSKTPFHTNPKANIVKEVFNSFRKQGLWTGAYFSKPDWHSNDYWWSYFPNKDRNVNYDPTTYPKRWQRFVDYTHNQVLELLTDYGKVDILWLDGGWVMKQPKKLIDEFYNKRVAKTKSGFMNGTIVNQDIQMDELVTKARKKQPDLIVVDRAVEGKNQNYLTPENKVPEKPLTYPWESCIISGGGWSYTEDAVYKSDYEVVSMLVDIVCKGGNLLLNFAPRPDGSLAPEAYELMKGVGEWMQVNQEGIYGTRAVAPYKEGKMAFTRKGKTIYAFYMSDAEEKELPRSVQINSFQPKEGTSVTLLGSDKSLTWQKNDLGTLIEIPKLLQKKSPCKFVWCFKMESVE